MIIVRNLSKIYHLGRVDVKALDKVNLTIAAHTMVCIMGKSGSGKSTLLRQLSLIDTPSGGDIMIDDRMVTTLKERRRSDMRLQELGYVFQEYALLPELTALENVYLPALMKGVKQRECKKRAGALLETVGLGDRKDHHPKELSGGEQQRVAIARALINQPKIIYADEPTANLDTISSRVVMETLQTLSKKLGVTIIFVSHDPDDKKYANEVIYLRDGKVSEPY